MQMIHDMSDGHKEPMTLLALPPEILEQILLAICESDRRGSRVMLPYLTICRELYPMVSKALLSNLRLRTLDIMPLTSCFIMDEDRARHIKRLDVRISDQATNVTGADALVAFGLLIFLLERAVEVQVLECTFEGSWVQYPVNPIDMKPFLACMPGLRNLREVGFDGGDWTKMEMLEALSGCSFLERIRFTNVLDYSDEMHLQLPHFPHLRHLQLNDANFRGLWQLQDMPSLIILRLNTIPLSSCGARVDDATLAVLHRLLELDVWSVGDTTESGLTNVLLRCRQLRALVLWNNATLTHSVFAAWPDSLRSCILGEPAIDLMALSRRIQSGLPHLQRLEIREPQPFEGISMANFILARRFLEATCSQRQIDLVYHTSRSEGHYIRATSTEGGEVE